MNYKSIIITVFSVMLLANVGFASLNVSLSDQGTNVRNKTTSALISGDLTVEVWDSLTGGTNIYNETFTNAIVTGNWNIMLGEDPANPLSLEYGKRYYKNYYILGEDADFTNLTGSTVERQFFYSPLGEIGDEDISSTGNLTANYFIGNGSLLTDVGTSWSTLVNSNIIPDTNNTYDLGNSTNMFKDAYIGGKLTVYGNIDPINISLSGSLDMDNDQCIYLDSANSECIKWNSSSSLFEFDDDIYTGNNLYANALYGKGGSGSIFYIYPNTVDTYPQIQMQGNQNFDWRLPTGKAFRIRDPTVPFVYIGRDLMQFKPTTATTAAAFEIVTSAITTGTAFKVSVDSADILPAGKIVSFDNNGTSIFYVAGDNNTYVTGDLNVSGLIYGNGSQLTDVGTDWATLVNSNIIPDTNNTYDLGNSTNMFKDAYIGGKLTVYGNIDPVNLSLSGVIDMKNDSCIYLDSENTECIRWNSSDGRIEMTDDTFTTGTSYVGVLRGSGAAGSDLYIRPNTADAFPLIVLNPNGTNYIDIRTGAGGFLRFAEAASPYYSLSYSQQTHNSDQDTSYAYQFRGTQVTSGQIVSIQADNSMNNTAGGRALQILGKAGGSTPIFDVDGNGSIWTDGDLNVSMNAYIGENLTLSGDLKSTNSNFSIITDDTGKMTIDTEAAYTYIYGAEGTRDDFRLYANAINPFPHIQLTVPASTARGNVDINLGEDPSYLNIYYDDPRVLIAQISPSVSNFYVESVGYYLDSTTTGVEYRVPNLIAGDALRVQLDSANLTTGNAIVVWTKQGEAASEVFRVGGFGDIWTNRSLNVSGLIYGNGSQLTDIPVSWTSIDNDLIPDANNTRDLGNSSHMYKDAYIAGKLTVYGNIDPANITMTGDQATVGSQTKNSPTFTLGGHYWNGSVSTDHNITMQNLVLTTGPIGVLETSTGGVGEFRTLTQAGGTWLYGGADAGDDLTLYASMGNTEPYFELLGNDDVTLTLPITNSWKVTDAGALFWTAARTGITYSSTASSGAAFDINAGLVDTGRVLDIDASGLTTGTALKVAIDPADITTGKIVSFESNGTSIFYIDGTNTTYVTGDLNITGTLTASSFENGDLIPAANSTYDIGSAASMWKDAYFNGSVGIGTNPNATLSVAGYNTITSGFAAGVHIGLESNGNPQIELVSTVAGGTPYIDFSNSSADDTDMRIRLTGNDALAIEGGRLGIGTTNPGADLEVAGAINATGYWSGGNQGLTGTATVRDSGGASDCTLVYTDGLLTSTTCTWA